MSNLARLVRLSDLGFCLRSTGWIELIEFAALHFHGLGSGKFPISVWLEAQGTRMQFASFPGRCTTSRTRHG